MTTTPHSVVIIAPQAQWDEIREFWQSQGYELGDGVSMSASGNDPATHRGAHMWLTDKQAREFTLRDTSTRFLKGYRLSQAQACMETFKAHNDGSPINYGSTLDGDRTARIFINTDNGTRSTKREFFDEVANDAGVRVIESVDPLQQAAISIKR